jgi:hypothetical protein
LTAIGFWRPLNFDGHCILTAGARSARRWPRDAP